MKQSIKLYIDNERVDLSSESIIALNYALEDTTNPTIVKNMFSRSIDLPGTPQNNRIFGRFYDLSRRVMLSATSPVGVGFNPLKRTPFSLFVESNLVERGYMQLNKVTMTKGQPTYTCTLFGGLGDFFYSLQFDSNGEKLSLANLDFGIDGATDAESEMDFTINKERVHLSWLSAGDGRNSLDEVVMHIPAYNGVPDDFDASHALVNLSSNALGLPTSKTDEGREYIPYKGYALAEFPNPLDEWEVRDLRSYLQRPALSARSLISAICNPKNNGGYTVQLDSAFFNEDNALYYDAYITLPMLSTRPESTVTRTPIASAMPSNDWVGGADTYTRNTLLASSFSLTDYPNAATVSVKVPLSFKIEGTDAASNALYLDFTKYKETMQEVDGNIVMPTITPTARIESALVARIVVYDYDDGSILKASPDMAFSSKGEFKQSWKVYNQLDSINRGATNIKGHFVRNASGTYIFEDAGGNNTFPIELSFVKGNTTNIRVELQIQRAYAKSDSVWSPNPGKLSDSGSFLDNGESNEVDNVQIYAITEDAEVVTSIEELPYISTGSRITKEILLGGTASPADYLLSYAKLFGLRFIKDIAEKRITITSRYFTGEIEDIEHRIDRGQSLTITPNVFDTKFMRLALDTPDSYYSAKYRDEYDVAYGQKRVDTAYEFNNATKEVYDGNVFQHAVPCLATSRLFYDFRNSDGVRVYPPIAENITYRLFRQGTEGIEGLDIDLPSGTYIDTTKTAKLNRYDGYDNMPKMCYFDMSDNQREAVDIANNLVIYCGRHNLTDNNGQPISYYLTDDLPEMVELNRKPCYLLTESTSDKNARDVAIAVERLPLFLSMRLIGERITDSFDFAVPKEVFVGIIDYPESVTLYNRYWQGLYADRMDVDTRKVEAMVNLTGLSVSADMLRKFYYFDNCYWLLNRITDYDPAKGGLTRCEFIKVKDINNYINDGEDSVEPSDEGFAYTFNFKLG